MNKTAIGWTDYTWNPIRGCSKVSAGCDNCYAETLALQWNMTPHPWQPEHAAENVMCLPHKLNEPFGATQPAIIFTCSMADVFHQQVPYAFVDRMFEVMRRTERHTYQVLTKRPKRALAYPGEWHKNVWIGTSVEDSRVIHRIDTLRKIPATLRFLSIEPLIGRIGKMDLEGIHWVIVGGESGAGFRDMDHAWAREIRDQCLEAGIPDYFKQSAALKNNTEPYLKEANGSKNKWEQIPPALSIKNRSNTPQPPAQETMKF